MIPQLNQDDRNWLNDFQQTIENRYPHILKNITIFGSKARGDSRDDSDLDVVITIREGDWKLKWDIEGLGYELAIGSTTVPTILIFTEKEEEELRNRQSSFFETVLQEGVSIP